MRAKNQRRKNVNIQYRYCVYITVRDDSGRVYENSHTWPTCRKFYNKHPFSTSFLRGEARGHSTPFITSLAASSSCSSTLNLSSVM